MVFKDTRFPKPKNSQAKPVATRYLYVSGLGDSLKIDLEIIRTIFAHFGSLQEDHEDPPVYMPPERRYCFIIYRDVVSATKALTYFHEDKYECINTLPPCCTSITSKINRFYETKVNSSPVEEPLQEIHQHHVYIPGLSTNTFSCKVSDQISRLHMHS